MFTYRLRKRMRLPRLIELKSTLERNFGTPQLFRWNISSREDTDVEYGNYSHKNGDHVVKLKFWKQDDYLLYKLLRQDDWP